MVVEAIADIGFSAVIFSPLPGWRGGLEGGLIAARELGLGALLLVFMSNPGADETFGIPVLDPQTRTPSPAYGLFCRMAVERRFDGVVVGATRPDTIHLVRELVGSLLIVAPGVGVQGGDPQQALAAGADLLIVGRAITLEEDMLAALKRILATLSSERNRK